MSETSQPNPALAEMLAAEHAEKEFGGSSGEIIMSSPEPPPPAPEPFVIEPPPWSELTPEERPQGCLAGGTRVEVHLTRIYRKVGVRSRAELSRQVAEGTLDISDS